MIKYDNYLLTFTEVPDEISLCFNITQCPCKCKECFEPWLAENRGEELTIEEVLRVYNLNSNSSASCICFMGGDNDHNSLIQLIKEIKDKINVKIAVYSGLNFLDLELMEVVDYYKFGPYIPERGPMNQLTTNQVFLKRQGQTFKNITNRFQKKKD